MQTAPHDVGSSPLHCGIDVGASATKLVLLDGDLRVRAEVTRPSGVDYAATARACLEAALLDARGDRTHLACCVATGYGRGNVEFADATRTEIQCHGLGCFHHFPRPLTIVDIGSQDNKIIRVDGQGRHVHFKMNRKCAAGTGAFLEEIALRLDVPVARLNALAQDSGDIVRLSSFCTVFAKTEILSHLRAGAPLGAIVRAAFWSVVTRVIEMDPLDGEVVMSGGVAAHNPVIVEILSNRLGRPVLVPPAPQCTGALGAALCAAQLSATPEGANAHA